MDQQTLSGAAVPIINSVAGPAERAAREAMDRITPTLTLNGYQSAAADTAIYPGKGTPLGLIYCTLKLTGEAGEVSEKVGKAIRDDELFGPVARDPDGGGHVDFDPIHPDRQEALKGELGDVLWYVANAANELGFTLSEIAQANLDKLADRKARGVLQGSGDNR